MSGNESNGTEPGAAGEATGGGVGIGVVGMARWTWRQLTSMRTALVLLFLLAVGAIPGSLIPQDRVNPVEVAAFAEENPGLAAWYERLGLFDVFGSVWFGAIYLLLMVSLVGCILPRSWRYLRALRARPPRAPRRLERLGGYRSYSAGSVASDDSATASGAPDARVAAAAEVLRTRRYRVAVDGDAVAGERGHLAEAGNLVFHVALVAVLVGIAVGSMWGFSGTALVVTGEGFANTVTQYDGYRAGRFFDSSRLPPFHLKVEDFDVTFAASGEQRGAAREFVARVAYTEEPGGPTGSHRLEVNRPLKLDGAQVHLLGHGYAPQFTVLNGDGETVFVGAVPFLPQDGNFSSTGVVKVPDTGAEQLGLEGFFLPTTVVDAERGPISVFPDALEPRVFFTGYSGDLGIDAGTPQSVYELDKSALTQLRLPDGRAFHASLAPGEEIELPDGRGTVRLDGYTRWVNLQISRDPGVAVVLPAAGAALGGLLLSLVVVRRRVWIRFTSKVDADLVEVAGLARTGRGGADDGLGAELDAIVRELRRTVPDVGTDGTSGRTGEEQVWARR